MARGDEKWIAYNTVERKGFRGKRNERPLTTPKCCLQHKNMMRGCIDVNPPHPSTPDVGFTQVLCLGRLKEAIDEKCSHLVNIYSVFFHQDDIRLHVPLPTRQKVVQLSCDVLLHPLSPLHLASTGYHFFWSLKNSFACKIFSSLEACKSYSTSSSSRKMTRSGRMGLWSALKHGEMP